MTYGANIYGLNLDGCRMNHDKLVLEDSNYKELLFSIPNLKYLYYNKA